MKKLLLMALSALLLASCTSTEDNELTTDPVLGPETEVYVNNAKVLHREQTRAGATIDPKAELGYSIPDDGKYLVYYFIRIDGNIPGEEESGFPASDYFPRTATKKTMLSEKNHGYVMANVEWKSNFKFNKYVYSPDGSAVQSIILEEPTIEGLLNANAYASDDFSGLLAHKDELHFIWYACKKQEADHCWHIDGVLTSKDRTDVRETKYGDPYPDERFVKDFGSVVREGNVEVDIHQQEHQTWNETKTSIHLRDVTDVTIEMPIELADVCPSDDFAIRAYDYKENILVDGSEMTWQTITVTVEHQTDKVVYHITGLTQELLDAHDGEITVEIHSYFTTDDIWDRLKLSTVKLTNTETPLKGQIHHKDDTPDLWVRF